MKKIMFLIVFSLMFPSLLHAETKRTFTDWLPRMREIFGDEQPTTTTVSSVEMREMKEEGQRFQHIAKADIEGYGENSNTKWLWWKTSTRIHFKHETSFILLEEIKSTAKEIDQGIIKSEFTVQSFNERLMSAQGSFSVGPLSTNDLLLYIQSFGEQYGDQINVVADGMIGVGMAAILAPNPVVTTAAVTNLGLGAAIKLASWIAFDKIGKEVDKDSGEIHISEETVRKYFSDCNNVIAKLHKLEGTVVRTTWVSGKGYTQFEISCVNDDLTDEDKEMIAKNVFRFNPVGVNSILPKDKKEDDVWDIDAQKVFGGILSTVGLNYNTLTGNVWVRDCGLGTQLFLDEKAITRQNDTDITILMMETGANSTLRFEKTFKDNSKLKVEALVPEGQIIVVTPQEDHEGPRYVKNVEMKGKIISQIDKPGGLLESIALEQNNVNLTFSYHQIRLSNAKK